MGVLDAIASWRRPLGAAVAAVAVVAAAVGCSGGTIVAGGSNTVVRVVERDFKISAPRRVRAGDVVLQASNRGPVHHELIVVRAPAAGAALPLRADQLTVDEEGVRGGSSAIEPYGPGSIRELRLHLSPGRYILLCNLAGHYLGGMHTLVVVR